MNLLGIRRIRSETVRWGSWAAAQLGLAAAAPHASELGRAELWARADEAVRLLLAPGPVYFSSAFLTGMATSFLFGLWFL